MMALSSSRDADARSEAVVNEANAIGTAYLRAKLTPPQVREPVQNLLREYLDLRVQAAESSLTNPEEAILVKTEQKQADLWQYVQQAAAEDGGAVTNGFVESVTQLNDSYTSRKAEILRHVPETVILLLMFTLVLIALVVGIASGAEGHRPSSSVHALAILIGLLFFLVIDLDRPRRGLIEVPRDSRIEMQTTIQSED
jgi:hypothetical protein